MKIFATLLAAITLVSIASAAPATPAASTAVYVPAPPPPLDVTLEPVNAIGEGIYNRADMSPEALAQSPIILLLTIKSQDTSATGATVSLMAEDMFGKPVAINGETQFSVPLQKGEGRKNIPFRAPGPGYFLIHAAVHAGADKATGSGDIGIVPPPIPGVRPDSLFCVTTGKPNLDLFQAVGMKKDRVCLPIKIEKQDGAAPGQVPPIDWSDAEERFADYKAHGVWPFLLTNYTLGGGDPISELAKETDQYGPPADELRYCKVYALMFQHFPEIKTTEFLNEPWLFAYGFAGSAADYDRFQKMFCEEVLKLRPDMRIIAGNSDTFVTDNIEPTPSCWKGLLSGVSDHPYTKDDSDISWRSGANARAYDSICEVARRMGLPYAYLTEAGTGYPPYNSAARAASPLWPQIQANVKQAKAVNTEIKTMSQSGTIDKARHDELEQARKANGIEHDKLKYEIEDNIENAAKLVQAYARAGIEGLFQGCGGGPRDEQTRRNTTLAVLTHFIEDRPAVADIWPSNEMIWGGIFANPKFVTDEVKALPRAKELAARWAVAIPKERQDDKTKVAIVWSATGQSNDKLDTNGTLTIPKADGLQAFDMTDREIPAGKDGLTVPFGNNPIYITSDTLSVIEIRDRIAHGIIKNVTPVNLYALSLFDDPTQPQKLSVRVENQLNVAVKGTLHLKVTGATEETSAPFSIEASKLAEVTVPWPKGVTPNENNQYGITVSAEAAPSDDSGAKWDLPVTISRQQIASVARFVKKTIPMTGTVDDWKGIAPVLLDSNQLKQEIDESIYTLNPNLGAPPENPNVQHIVAHVYTAYDQDNVYLAAAVHEDTFHNKAGEESVKTSRGPKHKVLTIPYKSGMPDGLRPPTGGGDVFEFGFGFRDRVPGWGRQMDDPYAWKGAFYDTDYSYYSYPSTEGDQLIRVWGADTSRNDGFQTAKVPGQGPVPNAKIKITRNEDTKITLYEMAIPRTELKLFDPTTGRCRFGFVLWTNGQDKGSQGLNWSDAAGVFDHWKNAGSFPPCFIQHTACQTFFGIEK